MDRRYCIIACCGRSIGEGVASKILCQAHLSMTSARKASLAERAWLLMRSLGGLTDRTSGQREVKTIGFDLVSELIRDLETSLKENPNFRAECKAFSGSHRRNRSGKKGLRPFTWSRRSFRGEVGDTEVLYFLSWSTDPSARSGQTLSQTVDMTVHPLSKAVDRKLIAAALRRARLKGKMRIAALEPEAASRDENGHIAGPVKTP